MDAVRWVVDVTVRVHGEVCLGVNLLLSLSDEYLQLCVQDRKSVV